MSVSSVRSKTPTTRHGRGLFGAYIRFYEAQVPREVIALAWQRLRTRCGPVLARNGPEKDIPPGSPQGVTLWMT